MEENPKKDREWSQEVGTREERKIKARRLRGRSLWYGLGMYGLVGWSVAIPTLIGVAIGLWIDKKWPSRFSFTLMFLFMGLVIGCLNAWHWVKKESRNE